MHSSKQQTNDLSFDWLVGLRAQHQQARWCPKQWSASILLYCTSCEPGHAHDSNDAKDSQGPNHCTTQDII
jgi:hypothetical protein